MDTLQDNNDQNGKEQRTFTVRLMLVILLINFLVYGLVYWTLKVRRDEFEQQAKVNVQNIVSLLEQSTTGVLEKVDVALRVSQDEVTNQVVSGSVDKDRIARLFEKITRSVPEICGMCISDVNGMEKWKCHALNGWGDIKTTIAGKTVNVRSPSAHGMIVGAPTFCTNANKPMVHIYRRCSLPDGGYAGAVGLGLDLTFFSMYFASVDLGEHGKIALLDKGQGIFAQYPPISDEEYGIASNKGDMPQFENMLKTNPYKGTYITRSPQDDHVQMVSYQQAGNWPIFIYVSMAEEDYLDDWYGEMKIGVSLGVVFALLSLLFGALAHRYWMARRAVLDMLTEKERLYRTFAEMTSDWFWEQDKDLVFTKMSGSLLDAYHAAPEQFIGKTRWQIAVDVPEEIMAAHKAEVLAHKPFKDFEYSFYNLEGDKRTISVSGMPMVDLNGKFMGYRGTGKDVTERHLYEESIHRLAQYDNLTGLPNRMLFNSRIEMAMSMAKREGKKFALMYFDLDKFKPVNDNYGHDAGDNLLQQVATRVSLELRDSDTVARLGGDEFAILQMNVVHQKDVEEVAERVIAALTTPFAVSGVEDEVQIGVSIGIAIFPEDAEAKERLLKVADTAMYEAKKIRNCYRMYTSSEHFGANKNKNDGEQG